MLASMKKLQAARQTFTTRYKGEVDTIPRGLMINLQTLPLNNEVVELIQCSTYDFHSPYILPILQNSKFTR